MADETSLRSQTFAQKALARAAGVDSVEVGQVIDARPHVVLSHDNSAAIRRIWLEFGQDRVLIPDRIAITLDHAVPAPTTRHAQNHAEIRTFVKEQGIANFWDVGRGICHQVLSEEATVLPGQLILGADSHTTHFGWMGAFGAGIGRSEAAALWATGELWLRVPETIRIELTGDLPIGVTAKDFALRVIGDLGADGGLYAMIEFGGDGIRSLSLDSRMVLPNMMAEAGAKSAYVAPDAATIDYLAGFLSRKAPSGSLEEAAAKILKQSLHSDPNADFAEIHAYDAGALEPYVACPHSVDNVVPLSGIGRVAVQQAFLGTCTNGRLEDLAAAAQIVRGRSVAVGTRFLVIPASSVVLQHAVRLGYIQALMEAGAVIGVPGCGPCMGNHMGVPAPGEVTVSSANRNFQGRMGTRDSEVYLANPAVVAASAIAGRIADPRELT